LSNCQSERRPRLKTHYRAAWRRAPENEQPERHTSNRNGGKRKRCGTQEDGQETEYV
jgi:hypothetical protein